MSVIILDDTDPRIQYGPIGNWSAAGSAQEYNGTTTYIHEVGNASVKFTGIRIAVFGTIGPIGSNDTAPQTSYAVDGGTPVTFTGTQAVDKQLGQRFYNSPLLSSGNHSLEITNLRGTLFIDYINITLSNASSSSSSLAATSTLAAASTLVAGTTAVLQSPSASTTKIPTDPTGSNSAPPIAAIVGGTLGGLAVICVLVFALFFVRRRDKAGIDAVPITENQSWSPPQQLPGPTPHPSVTPFSPQLDMSQPNMSTSTWSGHVPQIASHSHQSGKGRLRAVVPQQPTTAASSSVYSSSVSPPETPNDPPPGYKD